MYILVTRVSQFEQYSESTVKIQLVIPRALYFTHDITKMFFFSKLHHLISCLLPT